MKHPFLAFGLLALGAAALAGDASKGIFRPQPPEITVTLLKDIHTGDQGSFPTRLAGLLLPGNVSRLYLSAQGNEGGFEAWQYSPDDGTVERLSFITQNRFSDASARQWTPYDLDTGTVFFTAQGEAGPEVYTLDYLTGETMLLKDIQPEGTFTAPTIIGRVGDKFYFIAESEDGGRELWTTDGTEEGTSQLLDLNSGVGDAFDSQPEFLVIGARTENAKLYITANNGSTGLEVFELVGDDLLPVGDIREGSVSSIPSEYTQVGDEVYFSAIDSNGRRQLFVTGEGIAGIGQITMFTEGNPDVRELKNVGGRLLFVVNGNEIWEYDPATSIQPERLVTLPPPSSELGVEPFVTDIVASEVDDRFYFAYGSEGFRKTVWVSDGTEEGTTALEERPSSGVAYDPDWLTAMPAGTGIGLLYVANDPLVGREIHVTDGTPEGTGPIGDIVPGPNSSFNNSPDDLELFGGRVYFSAGADNQGNELWSTDGTETGTRKEANINTLGDDSLPRLPTPLGDGQVFFRADDGTHGPELWVTDGTEAGTRLVSDIVPGVDGSSPEWLTPAGDFLYFTADTPEYGRELWRTDGTEEGTQLFRDLAAGPRDGRPTDIIAMPPFIYCAADFDDEGIEVCRLDTSNPDNDVVYDIVPGPDGSFPNDLLCFNGEITFTAADPDDPNVGRELYMLPVDEAPTQITDIDSGGQFVFGYSDLTLLDNLLAMTLYLSGSSEPWISDGTPDGTKRMGEEGEVTQPFEYTEVEDKVYFTAEREGGRRSVNEYSILEENLREAGYILDDNEEVIDLESAGEKLLVYTRQEVEPSVRDNQVVVLDAVDFTTQTLGLLQVSNELREPDEAEHDRMGSVARARLRGYSQLTLATAALFGDSEVFGFLLNKQEELDASPRNFLFVLGVENLVLTTTRLPGPISPWPEVGRISDTTAIVTIQDPVLGYEPFLLTTEGIPVGPEAEGWMLR